MNPVHYSSERMDWETPSDLYDALDAEFHFTLDVCARADNTKCAQFFTPEVDGLAQEWRGVCWMNPPYGREIGKWIAKARESSRKWASTVVCLVPARVDTRWWHEDVMKASEIRLVRGRVVFVGATASAPFPVAIVVFRFGEAIPKLSAYALPGRR